MPTTIFDEVTSSAVVVEAVMLRAAANKTILIVEGGTDEKLLSKFVSQSECEIIIAGNKDKAVAAVQESDRRGLVGILAVVDSDLDVYLGIPKASQNIVRTDNYNIESLMLRSPALNRVIGELGSKPKIEALKSRGLSPLSLVLAAALPIGALRAYAAHNNLTLSFKDLTYSGVNNAFDVNTSAAVTEVYSKSKRPIDDDVLEFVEQFDATHAWVVTSGHDLTSLLGKGFRRLFGNQSLSSTSREEVEKLLRLAFCQQCFLGTSLASDIIAWEGNNVPYKCLA